MNPWVRWTLCCVYTGLVTVLSLLPSGALDKVSVPIPGIDKVAHFAMYAVYALLLAWTARAPGHRGRWILIILYCTTYGLLMECLQPLLNPGDRQFSIADMGANALGACTTWLAGSLKAVTCHCQSRDS
mgnify:CR=1 FL=1